MYRKIFCILTVCLCGCATTAKFNYRQNDMNMSGVTELSGNIVNIAADAEVKRAKAYAMRQCAEDKQCLQKLHFELDNTKEDANNAEVERMLNEAEKALEGVLFP